MSKLEDIERAVKQLSTEEMAKFRQWFEELQADLFDAKIEADMTAGKLDAHFERALADYAVDKSIKLP